VWCAIVGLLGLFVAPKFKQILLDFHMQPPAIFQLFDSVSDWIWVAGPVIVIILLACLGMQIRQTVRIPAPIWVLRPWRDWLFWHLPILHGLIRDRNMSDICISLADSVQLGYPLEVSLERLGQLNVNTILRQRILNWADGLRAGIPPVQAARQAPMPHLLVGMMSSARDNAQLAEVLSFVGRFHADRFLLRREAIRGAVIPVFTIFFGIVVALMALWIFVPLQELVAKYSW
jgi:type II secretory pathway component PulF